jgi:hypothetical protein
VDVWHLLGLDKLRAKINARAEKVEDYRKNKKNIERAKKAREVAGGIETAAVPGAVAPSADGSDIAGASAGEMSGEGASKKNAKKAAKAQKKKQKQQEDEAPTATTLFAEMNQKRTYEASQMQAAMRNQQGTPQGQPANRGFVPQGQPVNRGYTSQPANRGGAPVQPGRGPAPQGQPPRGAAPQGQPPRGANPPQGSSWVNRVAPGNNYGQPPRGGAPGNGQAPGRPPGAGGTPGSNPNQTRTWTRK